MYSGITSLKPTAGRIPLIGQGSDGGLVGVVGVHNTLGFMASSVKAIEAFMKEVVDFDRISEFTADPRQVPMPWRRDIPKKKLKIGWYDFDGVTEATPGARRAVKVARDLLAANGHEIVPYRVPCNEFANHPTLMPEHFISMSRSAGALYTTWRHDVS